MNRGTWYAIGAYVIWGLFPVYWKQIGHVPAIQLIGHRILWSFFMLAGIVLVSHQRNAFGTAVLTSRVVRIYTVAAMLIGINWFTYVWAVNAGFIVETSLGYFITPLVSVGLGVLVLREQLRPVQWLAVGLACAGVLYLTFAYGSLPWIALILAVSFGVYGLIKKTAPLGAIYGLTAETGILLLPALVYLLYAERIGQGAVFHTGRISDMLLVGSGLVTIIPLLLFASAVQRIPLSLVGVLQYIAPSLQFLIGIMVYKEPFTRTQFTGFSMVWAALILFGIEGFVAHRPQPVRPAWP